jgi:hypothetical protein
MVQEVMAIGPPLTMDVVFRVMVPPPPVAVMSQSKTVFPAESATLAQAATPVADASAWGMALNVSTPPLAAGAEGLLRVRVPSKVTSPMP